MYLVMTQKKIKPDNMTEEEIERDRLGKKLAQAIEGQEATYIPYDPVTKCLTKPPEWDDMMWEGFALGYDDEED
jgi:hypothetical protein